MKLNQRCTGWERVVPLVGNLLAPTLGPDAVMRALNADFDRIFDQT